MATAIVKFVPSTFFMWGFLKGIIYETFVSPQDDSVRRIAMATGCVPDTHDMFENLHQLMQPRCNACLFAPGKECKIKKIM